MISSLLLFASKDLGGAMKWLIPVEIRMLQIMLGDRHFPGEKGDRYVCRCRAGQES